MLSLPLPWKSFAAVDPAQEYAVMATRLPLRSYWQIPNFFGKSRVVREQLAGADGLVGYALLAEPLRKRFFTVSAWRSEADLQAFARAQPHAAIAGELRPRLAPTKFVSWTARGADLPIGWDEARRRLDA